MWPAEVTVLEPASPLHLTVARNGLQATYTHIHRKAVSEKVK